MEKNIWQSIFLYLKDKLSGKERYKLEKEMNRDPFLADAMEGFSEQEPEELEEDIKNLRRQLKSKSQDRRKPLYANLRIAAGIIILLGIGGIIILLSVPNLTKNRMAQHIEKEQEKPKSFSEEKIYSTEKEVFEEEEEIPPVTAQDKIEDETKDREIIEDDIVSVDDDILIEDSELDLEESTLIEETKKAEEPIKQFAFAEEEAIAVTEAEVAGVEKSRAKKVKGNTATFQKTDSNLIAETKLEEEQILTADEAGSTAERKNIAAQPQVTMKEELDAEAMPETSPHLEVELIYPEERKGIQHAKPAGGVEKIQSYLEEALQTDFAHKKLILEFSVNSEGAIDSPRVIESESRKEAKQIIELLVEGPQWQSAIYKEQTVRDKIRMTITY